FLFTPALLPPRPSSPVFPYTPLFRSPAFYEEGAEQKIYEEAPDIQKPDTTWYHPVMDDLSGARTRTVKSSQQVILTGAEEKVLLDRKSTRLNSSHVKISYAVFCLKKK